MADLTKGFGKKVDDFQFPKFLYHTTFALAWEWRTIQMLHWPFRVITQGMQAGIVLEIKNGAP